MSETTATIDILFDDKVKRNDFVNQITKNSSIEIDQTEMTIQDYCIEDEVFHLTLFSGGHDISLEVIKWLKSYNPYLSVAYFWSDENEKKLALKNGKKAAYGTVIKELMKLSPKLEAGIALQGSQTKQVKFLKNNSVDLLEEFQGVRHIDRVICDYEDDDNDKIVNFLISKDLISADQILITDKKRGYQESILFNISFQNAVKLILKGGDPNVLHSYDKSNLLQQDYYYEDYIGDIEALIKSGINVNHTDENGHNVLDIMSGKVVGRSCRDNSLDDDFVEIFSLLLDAGASTSNGKSSDEELLSAVKYMPKLHEFLVERLLVTS